METAPKPTNKEAQEDQEWLEISKGLEGLDSKPIFNFSGDSGYNLLYEYIERTGSPSSIYPLLGIKSKEFCVQTDQAGDVKYVTIETTPGMSLAANKLREVHYIHGGISAAYVDACSGAIANLISREMVAMTKAHRNIEYIRAIAVDSPVLTISELAGFIDEEKRRPKVITKIFQSGKLCVQAETELALIKARVNPR